VILTAIVIVFSTQALMLGGDFPALPNASPPPSRAWSRSSTNDHPAIIWLVLHFLMAFTGACCRGIETTHALIVAIRNCCWPALS